MFGHWNQNKGAQVWRGGSIKGPRPPPIPHPYLAPCAQQSEGGECLQFGTLQDSLYVRLRTQPRSDSARPVSTRAGPSQGSSQPGPIPTRASPNQGHVSDATVSWTQLRIGHNCDSDARALEADKVLDAARPMGTIKTPNSFKISEKCKPSDKYSTT